MGVMRIVKLGIISFVAFFILLYLMSLLIPSHVRISRAININKNRAEIFPYLADTVQWKKWNEMNTGKIDVQIKRAEPQLIETKWTYNGREILSSFRLEESSGVSVVQWYFDFELQWYPWEKFGSITFDKQFGFPMETSLNNLKKLIENSP
jgi:hypothetical protein